MTATAKRRVKLGYDEDAIGSIISWFSSGKPAADLADVVGDEIDLAGIVERVAELSKTVAALTGMDMVGDVLKEMQEQEAAGVASDDFKPPDVDSDYGGEEPSMLDTISDANLQSAYSLGQLDEDEAGGEWWEYIAQSSACDICAPLDGTQAPQDSDIWIDRIPPLHPRCVCALSSIPPQKVEAKEHDVPSDSRGRQGWGDPRRKFEPDLSDKPAVLLPLYYEKRR